MIINACGEGCFKAQTGGVTLMTGPFEGELSSRFKPDILIKNPSSPISPFPAPSSPFVVEGAGEYEIKGVEIFSSQKGVYLVKAEEMRLGFLFPGELNLEKLEDVSDCDILFTPVTDQTEKIVKQLEPKIIIPATPNYHQLLKTFNIKAEPQEKLTIKKKEVPETEMKIIILTS